MTLPPGLGRAVSWATGEARHGWGAASKGLVVLSHHTGIPVMVLAAGALVLSWRAARRASRMAFEFLVALVVVVAATRLGWIRW